MQNFEDKTYTINTFKEILKKTSEFEQDLKKYLSNLDQEKILEEINDLGQISDANKYQLQSLLSKISTNITKIFEYSLTVQEGFYTAVDCLVFYYNVQANTISGLIIIKRPDGKLAPIGGFTKDGETPEQAVIRESFEETGIKINSDSIKLLNVYGDPNRDPRPIHVVSLAYIGLTQDWPEVTAESREVYVWDLEQIKQTKDQDWFAKDHKQMALEAFNKISK